MAKARNDNPDFDLENDDPQGAATATVPTSDPELRKIALDLYKDLRRGRMRGYDPAAVAAVAVREARAFIDAMGKADEILAALPDDGLDDASCPNLSPKHPLNLKSRRFGNADTLAEFKELSKAGNEDKFRARCAEYAPRN